MWKGITNYTQTLLASNKNKHNENWLSILLVSTALFFQMGCETVPSDTGLAVLPPEDQIGLVSNDTSTILLETRIIDRIATANAEAQLFGNYIDPVFGRISATTFTQIVPGEDLNFGDTSILRVDSIVLALGLLGNYGKVETPQTIQLYEVSEDFPDIEDLYSNEPLAVYPTNFCDDPANCTFDFSEKFDLPVASGAAEVPSVLRVKLSDELAEKLLFAPPEVLRDKDRFKEFFKGIAITTAPVEYFSREPGAIFSTFVKSSNADITLYYSREDANGIYRPEQETFLINNDIDVKTYHTIIRSEAENRLLKSEQTGDMFHFLQAGGLINLFGKLPNISQIPTLGVNKADLVIKVDDSFFGSNIGEDGNRYAPIPQLRLYFLDNEGNETNPDEITEIATIRPQYDEESRSYTFGITPYVQRVMRGKEANNGFIIRPLIDNTQVNRIVIGGNDHPTRAPVMRLVYTKRNNKTYI